MIDKNSAEYKTIMGLYADGRVTAAERDKLFVAMYGDDALKSMGGSAKVVFKVYPKDGVKPSAELNTLLCSRLVEYVGVENVNVNANSDTLTVVGSATADDIIAAADKLGVKLVPKDIEVSSYAFCTADGKPDEGSKDLDRDLDDLDEELKDLEKEFNAFEDDFSDSDDDDGDDDDEDDDDDDDGDDDDDDEPEGLHVHIDDGRTLTEFLKGWGEKVKQAVGMGAKAAADTERILRETFKKTFKKTFSGKSSDGGDAHETVDVNISGERNNVIQTKKPRKYDVPYGETYIYVDRFSSDGAWSMCENATDKDTLLDECEDALNDEQYDMLEKLIEEQFTGKFCYIVDDDVFIVKVKPKKN